MTTLDPIRAALQRLVELDPHAPGSHHRLGWMPWSDAIETARVALDAAPADGPSLEEIEDLCEEHCFNVEGYESIECLQGLLNDAITRWGRPTTPPAPAAGDVGEALAARPLLEQVAAIGDCISEQTVGRVRVLANQASAWLAENPPGQPVAIEPRGCPMLGACSCVELPTPTAGEVGELVAWCTMQATHHEAARLRWARYLTRAAALLEQLSAQAQAPQPVAVSERLPGAEDCDAEGCIWLWDTERRWVRQYRESASSNTWVGASWLPAHALPIPTTTPAGQEGADG